MDILRGLSGKEIGAIRHIRSYRQVEAGLVLFESGGPADSLFVILTGEIQIYRPTIDGEVELNRLGPGELFGELGIISEAGRRTASARALTDATMMEIGTNPIDLFREAGLTEGAITFLQNLVMILARRLERMDRPEHRSLSEGSTPLFTGPEPEAAPALAKLEELIPKKVMGIFSAKRRLRAGDYLFKQDAESDGFFFIHEGTLEALKQEDPFIRSLGEIHAPAIAGEVGFFTNEPRTASVRANTDVVYTFFSGIEFGKLKKYDPEKALEILFSTAQLAVCLIYERETGRPAEWVQPE